ncbi:MAG: hypothetical protein JST85_22885 [Acidobacteria bacterium]|nr:hypothetical protein [Acidobacteriota bacterium]
MTLVNKPLSTIHRRIVRDSKEFSTLCNQHSFDGFLCQVATEFRSEILISALMVACYFAWLTVGAAGPMLPLAIGMNSVHDAFKHNRARRNVIVAGGLILVCITLLSCVSSFMIYREGFADTPWFVQQSLSLFAVMVVEGAFIWLVYGFTRAFSSFSERIISLAGMGFLVCVMLTNIITHFMMVKHLPLSPFQDAWLSWGAVSVFIGVLIFVLLITLSDPVTRLIRLEMRYLGKQQETILHAKSDGLDSEHIQAAMIERAELEARELAERIIGEGRQLSAGKRASVYDRPVQANFDNKSSRKPGKSKDNWI